MHLEQPGEAGHVVRGLRRERALTRKEFAYAVGLSVAYIRNIEAGDRVLRVSMAIAWSHKLGCEPAPLVQAAAQDQLTAAGVTLVVRVMEGIDG